MKRIAAALVIGASLTGGQFMLTDTADAAVVRVIHDADRIDVPAQISAQFDQALKRTFSADSRLAAENPAEVELIVRYSFTRVRSVDRIPSFVIGKRKTTGRREIHARVRFETTTGKELKAINVKFLRSAGTFGRFIGESVAPHIEKAAAKVARSAASLYDEGR